MVQDTQSRGANWHFETRSVHAGYSPDPTTRAAAVPIYQTAALAFDSAQHGADLFDLKVPRNIYSRIMNPTQDVLEQRLAALEGGIGALALASGQAAVTYSVLTIAEAGQRGRTWSLAKDVAGSIGAGNPHADSYGDPAVWCWFVPRPTAEPEPVVRLREPSAANAEQKRRFEQERLALWFGR